MVVGEDANNGTKHWLSSMFSQKLTLLSAVGALANSYGGAKFRANANNSRLNLLRDLQVKENKAIR